MNLEHALVVYPKLSKDEESIDPETIEKEIKQNIEPLKLKIHVQGIKRVNNNGVCFRVGSQNDSKKLKLAIEWNTPIADKILTKVTNKRNHKVIILNILGSLTDEEILIAIHSQNKMFKQMENEQFLTECKIIKSIKELQNHLPDADTL